MTTDGGVSLARWMQERLTRFETCAEAALPPPGRRPQRLHEAMRYAVLGGGKRVRPLLVYAAGEWAGAEAAVLDCAALAVEFVHVYSLIHDDLPCMDDDVLRRGRPTVHVAFDEATAMLAGDALQAEAFRVLADAPACCEVRAALMRELAHAASTAGMCGGQAIDLAAVGQRLTLEELETMHRMKTGALLLASVRMGALAARLHGDALQALDRYGEAIGLAFQIVDDVLDVEGSAEALGKTAGKDARQDKPTYVSVLGLAAARARAEALRQQAHAALAQAGAAAERLRQLADFIVLRSH
ncbi:MAG: polyprenyl synthetase family protein [Burkholderiaceae bacterium]|nr:polyprenyl synthetase family protein [Burkholderiaceae bacterium]